MKFWIILILFLIDRITKEMANRHFFDGIKLNFVISFNLVHNYGAALGIYIPKFLLIFFSFVALIVLLILYKKLDFLGIAFILGGLLGNLYDRVFYGYVIDFIHMKNFFVFNLADVFITLGGFFLFLKLIK